MAPLALADDQGHFVCVAIRDGVSEEIVHTVVTCHDLTEKTGIHLAEAQHIFQDAGIQSTAGCSNDIAAAFRAKLTRSLYAITGVRTSPTS